MLPTVLPTEIGVHRSTGTSRISMSVEAVPATDEAGAREVLVSEKISCVPSSTGSNPSSRRTPTGLDLSDSLSRGEYGGGSSRSCFIWRGIRTKPRKYTTGMNYSKTSTMFFFSSCYDSETYDDPSDP